MADSPSPDRPDPLPSGVEEALVDAFLLEGAERDDLLARVREQHPEHRAEIDARIRIHEDLEDLTGAPPWVRWIGPYEILGVLGEGGMGTVYRARRLEPLEMHVAIKVIRLGMDCREVMARFERERQALAAMRHDNIARVHNAGTTEAGQPYFVMELVEGPTITDYCNERRLDLKQRIELFQHVCHGVQHAHQKGVVHRDLKPSNILVAEREGEAVPKIIDFGLARATDRDALAQSFVTRADRVLGTPEYMSPEQASGNPDAVDTRADVYSLGVVLYELLCGALPFDRERLRRVAWAETQRILCEVDPAKPSTRLSEHGEASSHQASLLRMSRSDLVRELRVDLDWIILGAIAKEPDSRYGSPQALAADLQRYLDHEPVHAGPPAASYRLRKFLRRYRSRVAATAVVLLAAFVGSGVVVLEAIAAGENAEVARRAEGRARDSEAEARAQKAIADQRRVEARRQAAKARRERDLFRGLATVVELEDANSELSGLRPAWPGKIAALESWLDRAAEMKARLPRLREILDAIEARQIPPSPAQREADRATHPSFPALVDQRKRVASERRAMRVRSGDEPVPDVPLPADTPTSAFEVFQLASAELEGFVTGKNYGDHPLALALARRALELAKVQAAPPQALVAHYCVLARALFANGLDEEALSAQRFATTLAPDRDKAEFELAVEYLEEGIRTAQARAERAEKELSRLEALVGQQHVWRFADDSDRFLHSTMRRVERDLVEFLGPRGSPVAVRRWLGWAKRIRELSEAHPMARVTWAEAREAIRDADGVTASKLYAAGRHRDHPIDLTPQLGLVPIGMNPKTGLWEFYHLRSAFDPRTGEDPAAIPIPRHAEDGSIAVSDTTGIVFVLIPGGEFVMGAQSADPAAANYDPLARPSEAPHSETVRPFFLARHELTQGQWIRLSLQDNPSHRQPDNSAARLNHPVENVSWTTSRAALHGHGLRLPSEPEWEYGCRAGRDWPWYSGPTSADLEGHANIKNPIADDGSAGEPTDEWPFDDGHRFHTPVGSFLANRFGLHDVHGNVNEWCETRYPANSPFRCVRGGSTQSSASEVRCASRESLDPDVRAPRVGLRPARTLR